MLDIEDKLVTDRAQNGPCDMCRRVLVVGILAAFILVSPSSMASLGVADDATSTKNVIVLKLQAFSNGFTPCSRAAPEAMSAFWEVSAAEALSADTMLLAYLREKGLGKQLTLPVQAYGRQYLGFVRNGVRWIYVNAFPLRGKARLRARAQLELVQGCDGGGLFWGAEFDIRTKHFSGFAINGEPRPR